MVFSSSSGTPGSGASYEILDGLGKGQLASSGGVDRRGEQSSGRASRLGREEKPYDVEGGLVASGEKAKGRGWRKPPLVRGLSESALC